MRKYGYLVVEGPHDVEFAYRLLSPHGLRRVQYMGDLDPFFLPLIPRDFPPNDDLQMRVPVPLFLQSDTHAIAVHSAVGDSKLVSSVEVTCAVIEQGALTGIGLLLDSDKVIPALARYTEIRKQMKKKGFTLGDKPAVILEGPPKLGAYVLPENATEGTLEDLLLDSASAVYPGLLASAMGYVSSAMSIGLTADDLREINKPAGKNKAIVGAMASILRPGKAVQVSIQDNRWLKGAALLCPRIKEAKEFLSVLFDLP
ncbi:MAG: hypothetical protein M0Q22_08175 [Sulfuritalea sp.]|jgi:hypothetical protein|nr:hypothetical protein [Sulfuritalea sp.]